MKKTKLLFVVLLVIVLLPTPSTVHAVNEPIKIGNEYFNTLEEAVASVDIEGEATIEILDDVAVNSDISIQSNISLVSSGSEHIINMGSNTIYLLSGSLILGSGDNSPLLISGTSDLINVTGGNISIDDGIRLESGNNAVTLYGSAVSASISGGVLEGDIALVVGNGAKVTSISGGTFRGSLSAVHVYDQGTTIGEISGGVFYQSDINATLHGSAVFIEKQAEIVKISGGNFTAEKNNTLTLIRGGSIGEISGGDFVMKRTGTTASNDRTAAIYILVVETNYGSSKIDTISGGNFYGGYFGALLYTYSASETSARIEKITGGNFEGTIGYQNDVNSLTKDIIGGTFTGTSYGMLNNGKVDLIGETASFTGSSRYGIYNYNNGVIEEINGGNIIGLNDGGIYNTGRISLISGGTVIGSSNAIWDAATGSGKGLNTISGGVFLGKNDVALRLSKAVTLEPGLEASRGDTRFWGKDGEIFNDDNLVDYPENPERGLSYVMSFSTENVDGIEGYEFKYLRLPVWDLVYNANIPNDANGFGVIMPSNQLNISLDDDSSEVGEPEGKPITENGTYSFVGWNTEADGNGIDYNENAVIPAQSSEPVVTLYAQWEFVPSDIDNGNDTDNTDNTINGSHKNKDISNTDDINQKEDDAENRALNPKTGDYDNVLNISALMLVFMLVLFSVILYRKQSNHKIK